MIDREKKLAAGVALVVALWGADLGWNKYQTVLEKNQNVQQNVARNLSKANLATARGMRARKKLQLWQSQSLPTNIDIAQSLYQDWLQQLLIDSGLKVKNNLIRRTNSKDFKEVSFVVSATGTLDQLTDFLYRFYQSPHLHRISSTDIAPNDDRSALIISLTIDALSLGKGNQTDKLAEGSSDLIQQTLKQLQKNIGSRNLFAAYKPPQSSESTVTVVAETEDTEAKQAIFSSINYGQNGWLMSIRMKDSGKVYYFREGDEIEIGRFFGTVEMLDGEQRRAIIMTDTEWVEIWFGQTLDQAAPLDDFAS